MRPETTTPKRNGRPALLLCAASAFLLSSAAAFAQVKPGWKPVPRPGSPAQLYEDFDLLGLQEDYSYTNTIGSPFSDTYIDYGGLPNGIYDYVGVYFNNSLVDTLSYTDKIYKLSQYKWQWIPPNDPVTMMPDATHFPQPALFSVGEVLSVATITPDDPAYVVGLKILTQFGLEGGSHPDVVSKTVKGAVAFADYQILTGTAKSDTSSVTFAPYAYLTASATPGGGSAQTLLQMIENVSPILLGAPDPFKNPDVTHDGSNQFVYNDNGYLAIPADVHLATSYLDISKWLPKYVDWKTDIPTTKPENTMLLPYTRVSNAAGGVMPSVRFNGVTQTGSLYFSGLPLNNADFGNHKVTLLVQTSDPPFQPTGKGAKVPAPPAVLPPRNLGAAQKNGGAVNQNGGLANVAPPPQKTKWNESMLANIQTFFDGMGTNHPLDTANNEPAGVPNWYHYYQQIYQNVSGNMFPANAAFDPIPAPGGMSAG